MHGWHLTHHVWIRLSVSLYAVYGAQMQLLEAKRVAEKRAAAGVPALDDKQGMAAMPLDVQEEALQVLDIQTEDKWCARLS